jgi:hypothetical protein
MILNVHAPGAVSYDIRQVALALALGFEADTIAYADSDAFAFDQAHRDELRDRIVAETTVALTQVGDTYTAPNGVRYSLTARHVENVVER